MNAVSIPAAVVTAAGVPAAAVAAATGIAVDAAELIGGRAALLGLDAGCGVSAGGATRLLSGADGWCALTLSRPDDIAAVPALVERDEVTDPWAAVGSRVADGGVAAFADRARMLGLPVGVLAETAATPPVVRRIAERGAVPAVPDLLVADLSSMWAGPLCGHLLARAGATVVKVESRTRPDGTRTGPPAFFDWMNAGKLSYEVDFNDPAGLVDLLAAADVVLESSRPSALERRGLGPRDIPPRPGRIWVRITGHGTAAGRADWVAFGDDAAVSGGLVGGTAAAPQFCGDAIADPLTGIHAAQEIIRSHARGGGELIELAMAAVAAGYAGLPRDGAPVGTPPRVTGTAAALGRDTDTVTRLVTGRLGAPC